VHTAFRFALAIFMAMYFHTATVAAEGPAPIVIMIGVDGLRADAVDRVVPPNLTALAHGGVRSEGMIAAMPTKTFVNFYTLATGLHPKNHGFISNYPYDRKLGRIFDRNPDAQNPDWWLGEPIWVTAEKQHVKAATYFWVGSEVAIEGIRPTYWKPFDQNKDYGERVTEVLAWLALPEGERPGLITLYFSAVDTAAHDFGVGSDKEKAAILNVDGHIGTLIEGIKKQGLFAQTNIVIVSDHGMTNLSAERVINLDNIVDLTPFIIPDWHKSHGPVLAPFLNLYGPHDATVTAQQSLTNAHPNMKVWMRGDFPAQYHFDHPDREPDLMILADTGWSLYASEDKTDPIYMKDEINSAATHGYDNRHTDMHATFIAQGPAFQKGMIARSFDNVEVYGILACALGINPAKNDGNINNIKYLMNKKCS